MNVYVAKNAENKPVSIVMADSKKRAEEHFTKNKIVYEETVAFTQEWFEKTLAIMGVAVLPLVKDVMQTADRTRPPSMIVYEGKIKMYAARGSSGKLTSIVIAGTKEDAVEYWKSRGYKAEIVEEQTPESFEQWKKNTGMKIMPMYNADV